MAGVLLTFTPEARAEPEVPHRTFGAIVRAGSVAGFSEFRGESVSAIGGSFAVGHRFGRITLEVTYDRVRLGNFQENTPDPARGSLQRAGLAGRLDALRIHGGENTLLILFVEAGFGRQRADWVTDDSFARTDGVAGGGFLLDHRFEHPIGFPSRVGWHLGWRFTAAPPSEYKPTRLASCKNQGGCPPPTGDPPPDIGLLLTSGLTFTW